MNTYMYIVSFLLNPKVLHTFPLVSRDVHQGNKIPLGSVHRCEQVQLSSSYDSLRMRPKPGEKISSRMYSSSTHLPKPWYLDVELHKLQLTP